MKILFFGDSITEQGNQTGGYIWMLRETLKHEDLYDKYELIGSGIAGNTVRSLQQRMDKDVLQKGPEVVVIFIGVNDIWHEMNGTDGHTFETIYNTIVTKLLDAKIKVVVCTPTVIGERRDGDNPYDDKLDAYSMTVKLIADKYELTFVDLRTAFKNYLHVNNPENKEAGILTVDGVHLNEGGNRLVAEEMWKMMKELKDVNP